jgi:hypothetical protein
MAGQIKKIIDRIIEERSKGNPAIAQMTIAKLILKGLNPNKFDSCSEDDPEVISKLLNIAKQLNVMNTDQDSINIKSVFSTKTNEEDIVMDIKSQLNDFNVKLLVFFASSKFEQNIMSRLLQEAFMDSIVVGCTTAGEMVSGKLLNNSVAAMAISSNIISDAKAEVIDHKNEEKSIDAAFFSFEEYFHENAYTMDTARYAGLILIDGVSMKEERIMDLIGNRTNVIFVGGSAGDDMRFKETHVSANGKTYIDSTVLLMLKLNDNAEFGVIKTQSFKALDKTLTANKVIEKSREVIEFNNKPAAVAYAEALGLSSADNLSQYFMTNPVGLLKGENDIYIRSPQMINGTSMKFYCNILEGMEVRLLDSTNIIEDTKNALEDKIRELGKIDGIIDFDCIERTLVIEKSNLKKQYGEIFKDIPAIGFSTYGEQYIGHINQTATMLVFKLKRY